MVYFYIYKRSSEKFTKKHSTYFVPRVWGHSPLRVRHFVNVQSRLSLASWHIINDAGDVGGLTSCCVMLSMVLLPCLHVQLVTVIGPIPWGHSGPLCHALLLLMSWTSHAACAIAIAGVRLATPGDWQVTAARSSEWSQHFSNASCIVLTPEHILNSYYNEGIHTLYTQNIMKAV